MIHHCHDIKADNLPLRYLVGFLRHKHTDTVTFSLIEKEPTMGRIFLFPGWAGKISYYLPGWPMIFPTTSRLFSGAGRNTASWVFPTAEAFCSGGDLPDAARLSP